MAPVFDTKSTISHTSSAEGEINRRAAATVDLISILE